jgi:hypothetical protein
MQQRSYQDILLLIARDRACPNVFISNSLYCPTPLLLRVGALGWALLRCNFQIASDIVSYESA